jgi:hypothetical protein
MRKKVVSDCIALAVICLFPSIKLLNISTEPGTKKFQQSLKTQTNEKWFTHLYAYLQDWGCDVLVTAFDNARCGNAVAGSSGH